MSETERPFLPMSGELGGDFMSGMADSIRERRAREVPGWEGVEDEWEDEWEEEEEWKESLTEKVLNVIGTLLPRLVDFAVDVATIAVLPTLLTLLALALLQRPVFDFLETALMLWSGTAVTLMIANAKQKLLQRLRHLRFR